MANTLEIGMIIHQNNEWLGRNLALVGDEALSAHEDGKYQLSVVRAGAFLEGLIEWILNKWEIECEGQQTLGPMIGMLRKSNKAPIELLERLGEANTIRNRAPHNKPHELSQVMEGDSFQILNIVGIVVKWAEANFQKDQGEELKSEMMSIFLSVGGPHRLEQQQFVQQLRDLMRGVGVKLCTLSSDEYSEEKPFAQILALMSTCKAALIIGLDRSHAYAVFEREKSDKEKLYQDQYIPTAWNQIEGTMASALGLRILVLREIRLHKEGIFEVENHGHEIRDFDIRTESRGLSSDLRKYLTGWVNSVRKTVSDAYDKCVK